MSSAPSTSRFSYRRAAAIAVTGGLLAATATSAQASSARARAAAGRLPATPPRVLLIGDSILDQQGSAAAFLLRQAGVKAKADGVWNSGLLTVDQYDDGRTKPGGFWLRKAKHLIATFDPDVVGVYMNHNYWLPHPHDAHRRTITNLRSPSGQRMIGRQARALITILRARHAQVFFIAPIPAGSIRNANPNAWNPIWRGYTPVLRAMHVPVVDSARPLQGPDGLRIETKPSCSGAPERIRPPKPDLHLTRFGAGLAGTALATYVADLVQADLRGNAAPGDTTGAFVPTPNGGGYWLVGCDGSVYQFGNARKLAGVRAAVALTQGVVAAAATPTGAGLWLITADGGIVPVGDAAALAFSTRPVVPVTDATATPDGTGLWATTGTGVVLRAGSAVAHGGLAGVHLDAKITGIAATHDGGGYWLSSARGNVVAFGSASSYGSIAQPTTLSGAITGIAPTADDRGYWLVGTDGGVFAFGNAPFHGTAIWQRPPSNTEIATPGPAAGIVAAPSAVGAAQGYWVFGATGRVSALGAATSYGGDNNLAMGTQ